VLEVLVMHRRALFPSLVFALVLVVLGYVGWRYSAHRGADSCYACYRPIHANTTTVAVSGGKARVFCCPSCALTEHRQSKQPVTVLELRDYGTNAKLAPEQAYMVQGSDVEPCHPRKLAIGADKQPLHAHFDRCTPGLVAFAAEDDARAFVRRHGGQVVPFSEMAAAYR
jgi:hypothetical protein